jgi:hypothetical protein
VLQDLAEQEQELIDSEQEFNEIQKQIALQRRILNGEQIDYSDATLQIEIDNLQDRLSALNEFSTEYARVEKELNDKIIEQNKKANEEEKKEEKDFSEERLAIQQALINKLDEFAQKRSQQRIEEIGEEITASEKELDRLRGIADKGVLGADKSLAAEQKKQAELKKQQQEEERKQELTTAGLKILSALLEQGKSPQQAVPEVGILLGALPSIIDALPTFYEGTETTVADALGRPHLNTSKDSYIIRADGQEKILNPSQSARTGNKTTEEITNIVEHHENDLFKSKNSFTSGNEVLSKFDKLEKSVNNITKAINDKPVLTDIKYDKWTKEMIMMMSSKNKVTNTRSKGRSLFD